MERSRQARNDIWTVQESLGSFGGSGGAVTFLHQNINISIHIFSN